MNSSQEWLEAAVDDRLEVHVGERDRDGRSDDDLGVGANRVDGGVVRVDVVRVDRDVGVDGSVARVTAREEEAHAPCEPGHSSR